MEPDNYSCRVYYSGLPQTNYSCREYYSGLPQTIYSCREYYSGLPQTNYSCREYYSGLPQTTRKHFQTKPTKLDVQEIFPIVVIICFVFQRCIQYLPKKYSLCFFCFNPYFPWQWYFIIPPPALFPLPGRNVRIWRKRFILLYSLNILT